jgi:hypothetical protein
MVNLPIKGSNERVEGQIISNGQIQIANSNGYVIEQVHYNPNNLESLASQVARLVTEARDAGFAQGQAHVRSALGL